MKKTDLERLISRYIDGELDPRQSVAVSNLIQSNSFAAEVYREYNGMREMFGALRPVRAPEGFREQVMALVKERYPAGRPVVLLTGIRALSGQRFVIAVISGVTAVCLIAFATFWMVTASLEDSHNRTVARIVERTGSPVRVISEEPVPAPVTVDEEPFIRTPPVPLSLMPSTLNEPVLTPTVKRVRVGLVLKEEKRERFSGRLLKICSERELSFQKSFNDGQLQYVFHLDPSQYEQLVRWLEKQTDLVASLDLPEGTVTGLNDSDVITVTFEVAP